jgi:hypothetical protein
MALSMKMLERLGGISVCMAAHVGCSAADSGLPAERTAEQAESLQIEAHRGVIASELFGRDTLIHGVTGDSNLILVTEPLSARVAVHDRLTGHEVALLPAPPGGWLLPFQMRIVNEGRLVVLDAGGFPGTPSIPRVYDYDYRFDRETHAFSATLVRSVRFDGLPIAFSEDVEVLEDGTYAVSDVVLGALWLILSNGSVVPGIVPESFDRPIPELTSCVYTGPALTVDGIPFNAGGFAPGVGSLATADGYLYYGNGCRGGIHRLPVASLFDTTRSAYERAADSEIVSAGVPDKFEVLKGLAFNRWDPRDRRLYVLDTLGLRLLRVDVASGRREVLGDDPLLFNFPVTGAFLPSPRGFATLVVASDQEHRFAGINQAITTDIFQLPFLVTKVLITD